MNATEVRSDRQIRIHVQPRQPSVHVAVRPDCSWFAFACRGLAEKTKVVASGYGKTEAEALKEVEAGLLVRENKSLAARTAASKRRRGSALA